MKQKLKCNQQVYLVDDSGMAVLGGRLEHPSIRVSLVLTYASIIWDNGRVQNIYSYDTYRWSEIVICCQLHKDP